MFRVLGFSTFFRAPSDGFFTLNPKTLNRRDVQHVIQSSSQSEGSPRDAKLHAQVGVASSEMVEFFGTGVYGFSGLELEFRV